MNQPSQSEYVPGQPGVRFDPYVRLVRSLLPRTSCIALFGPSGELIVVHRHRDRSGPDQHRR